MTIKYAWRAIVRDRGVSAAVVVVLGVAIGAITALFAVIDRAILHPLRVDQAERLVTLTGAAATPTGDRLAWWGECSALAGIAEYSTGAVSLSHGGLSERISAAVVSASFFTVMRVSPKTGRGFLRDDEVRAGVQPAAISAGLWTRSFGNDPAILGQTVELDASPYTIVAVIPAGFGFPGQTDVWVPRRRLGAASTNFAGADSQASLPEALRSATIARLRDGASVMQARIELNALLKRLKETFTKKTGIEFGDHVGVTLLNGALAVDHRPVLVLLFTSVGLFLLMACATAANLLLARASSREKEISIRFCLGAGRLGIASQALMESLLLALAGGGLGLMLSVWIVQFVRSTFVGSPVEFTPRAAVFAFLVSISAGVLAGFAPAVRYSFFARGFSGMSYLARSDKFTPRLRSLLVAGEIGVALVLATSSLLTLRSLQNLLNTKPGFQSSHVIAMDVAVPRPKPGGRAQDDAAQAIGLYKRLLKDFTTAEGVAAVGLIDRLPLRGDSPGYLFFDLDGKPVAEAQYLLSSANYFSALGIPLLQGRTFGDRDHPNGAKVIMINQTFAGRYWPSRSPIGEGLTLEGETSPREIVGVVGDVKFKGLQDSPEPQFYLPYTQPYGGTFFEWSATIVARASAGSGETFRDLRRRSRDLDKNVTLFNMRTMENVIEGSVAPSRVRSMVLSAFGSFAFILASLGVYGVVSHSVLARTREIGVRVSFGAAPKDILLLVLRQSLRLGSAGVAAGLVVGFWFRNLTSSLLFGVGAADPASIAVCAFLLIASTLLASAIPALWASRIEPCSALRHE